ncbi:HAMP domain-containing protein [Pseudomonas fluorescens]|uniref:sensor histidine kinase n=1 Tax=Pseudomonas TaxID=286 RepID=UPI0010C15244|nr:MULTISPECIES: ATP-binding protein [Pseudomonas]MBD8099500.1 HAMP domain-containing protein [Pseudomonas fluorescens]MBD8776472.1 HAMP domain-containing protein [Pseudomonas fluorescens]MBD8781223.1 HAMP domain-containing protein [Pseudomonas fluorescens]MBD8798086.1 HAMP domain-containing protein [Pseudomonas fluorescens]TKK30450.1 two-component sensor histidine kinase [Pseudomonas sp. CFBP13528]
MLDKPPADKSQINDKPLWRWIGMRMSLLAIGAVVVISVCMWINITLADWSFVQHLPPGLREELQQLRADPGLNEPRLRQLVAQYYPLDYFQPAIANHDWLVLVGLVLAAIPIIIACGLWFSRPLSSQFSTIAQGARRVAGGDFLTRLPVHRAAPDELQRLVSDFNSMSTQLERYERDVRESSAVIAHELRTPLNAAMGRVQGMLDEVFPSDAAQLGMVKRQLDQLSKLVDDLHLLSMARAGRLVLERSDFPLMALVAERLAWFEPQLDQAGVRTQVSMTDGLRVHADRDRLGQVINILVDNLLRYAAGGGELNIVACQVQDQVVIEIGDRGPGIEAQHLDSVFDRFWRAERSRARYSGGSGLGLSIARAICQAHGGAMTASNLDEGGTLIRAQFPV